MIKGAVLDQCIDAYRKAGRTIPQMAEGMEYKVGRNKYLVGLSERTISRRLEGIAERECLKKADQKQRVMAYLEHRKSRQ